MTGLYAEPFFQDMTIDSFQKSQIYGIFLHQFKKFKEEVRSSHKDRYTTFFEDSQVMRDFPIYKVFLYFNLPYETIIKPQMVPIKILEISNDNDDEKVPISRLYRYFEAEDKHIARMQFEEENK